MGYLFDLRNVFRNCLLKENVVDDNFATNTLCAYMKEASAFFKKPSLLKSLCPLQRGRCVSVQAG